MSEFFYKARTSEGKMKEGIIEASSVDSATETLHKKGLMILVLEEAQKGLFEKDLSVYFSKPNKDDLVIFTRQLSTLIDANVPLVESLQTLARQTPKASFGKIVGKVADSVEGGAPLSQAFSEHKIFSRFFISLVKAGEVSGRIQATLIYLADYLERSAELQSKIRGALAYPAFIVFTIIIVGTIMATTILPQLLEVLGEMGMEDLPLSTKILIFATDFINDYILIILAIVVIAVLYFRFWVRTEGGRMKFDRFKISVPTFGEIAKKIYLARISESLSTLIKSGVPILESLRITGDVANHAVYKKILAEAEENVRGGGTISEIFSNYEEEIPVLVSSMLAIGEKTGKTDFMLEHIYKFYKSESDRNIANLSQFIEPILILFLGVIVGIIVASILLPIYNLVGIS